MRTYPRHITTTYSGLAPTHVRPDDLGTCISCGLCLNDCPTYRVLNDEADSPRGRIQLIRWLVEPSEERASLRSAERGPLPPPGGERDLKASDNEPLGKKEMALDEVARHLDACLVCRACETACPSGVPFGRIMEGAREVLHERRREGRLGGPLKRLGLATIAS